MNILVLDCGITIMEYELFDIEGQAPLGDLSDADVTSLAKGRVKDIGMDAATITCHHSGKDDIKFSEQILDHENAVRNLIKALIEDWQIIPDKNSIDAVGHRVVHGGEKYFEPVLITQEVVNTINSQIELAPLHNPYNLMGIYACRKLLPGIPQVAVFDTSFHQTMPKHAYIYALPYDIYKRLGIRRFGFHGPSHKYAAYRAAKMCGRPLEEMLVITCHLGRGSSITAVKCGMSIDTSMGYTPLEGLVMDTRCGDIDPEIVLHLMTSKDELTIHDVECLLNKQSGLLGISGVSSFMKDIIAEAEAGNERAKLAIDIFTYRLRKYIGAYAFALGGVDAIVFTGPIGERYPLVRERVCEGLEAFGIEIDRERNESMILKEGEISSESSKVKVLCIPTHEELVIALATRNLIASISPARTNK
ncbi:MAG: acetate/propionate family kinase [bacterium]